jgi:hypothetical protein
MIISVEQPVEWVVRETEVLGDNLHQCHFAHHKSHMNLPGFEPGSDQMGFVVDKMTLCPPQIPYELTQARNRAAAVGSRQLAAWATAWHAVA